MYWEEVYELYEYASNLNTLEKNESMKFNYLLHANSENALSNWQDLLIPFPHREWKQPIRKKRKEVLSPKFMGKKSTSKMTPEQRKRAEYVKQRVKDHQEKARKELQEYRYGK